MSIAILLDFDGTICGDVNAAVCEYEIITSHCPTKLPIFKALLLSQLKSTILIRPGFQSFMRNMQRREVDVFIYTASEAVWAKFIIPLVEQAIGVPFARPLFTRAHCKMSNGGYMKPCKNVLVSICNTLKKKRRAGITCPQDLHEKLLFIDNSSVLLRDVPHAPHVVLCPTYDSKIEYDVLRLVPEEVFSKHYQSIYNKLLQYELIPKTRSITGKESVRILYYHSLARTLALQRVNNRHWQQDTMWPTLEAIFQRYNPKKFDRKMLKYITAKINKPHHSVALYAH